MKASCLSTYFAKRVLARYKVTEKTGMTQARVFDALNAELIGRDGSRRDPTADISEEIDRRHGWNATGKGRSPRNNQRLSELTCEQSAATALRQHWLDRDKTPDWKGPAPSAPAHDRPASLPRGSVDTPQSLQSESRSRNPVRSPRLHGNRARPVLADFRRNELLCLEADGGQPRGGNHPYRRSLEGGSFANPSRFPPELLPDLTRLAG